MMEQRSQMLRQMRLTKTEREREVCVSFVVDWYGLLRWITKCLPSSVLYSCCLDLNPAFKRCKDKLLM